MEVKEVINDIKECYKAQNSCSGELIRALINELYKENIEVREFLKNNLTLEEYKYVIIESIET